MRNIILMVSLCLATMAMAANDDASQIRTLIAHTYDKPDAKVDTRPVTVVGSYAVAAWRQGERGGRALLLKKQGKWTVQLCSGKALRTVEGLTASRVPRFEAEELSRRVIAAESSLAAAERARFDAFGEELKPQHHH